MFRVPACQGNHIKKVGPFFTWHAWGPLSLPPVLTRFAPCGGTLITHSALSLLCVFVFLSLTTFSQCRCRSTGSAPTAVGPLAHAIITLLSFPNFNSFHSCACANNHSLFSPCQSPLFVMEALNILSLLRNSTLISSLTHWLGRA